MDGSAASPQSEADVRAQRARTRRRIIAYFKPYGGWFLAGGACLLATNWMALTIPGEIGAAVQLMRDASASTQGFGAKHLEVLAAHGKWIIALAIGAGLARVASRILIFNAGRFIEFDLRNELFARLTRQDASFYDELPTGDITSRVINDATYVRLLYAITFLHAVNTLIAYGIALQKMVSLDWRLMLWCFAPYLPLVVALRYVIRAMFEQTKIVQGQLSDLSTKVQENLAGVTVVKTFNLQGHEEAAFGRLNEQYYQANMRLAVLRGALTSITGLMAGAGTLVVLAVGGQRVLSGGMSIGEFVAFNGYVVGLAFPTAALGWVFSVWNRGLAAFERLEVVLDREPLIQSPDAPEALPARVEGQAAGEVRFEGVTFGYGDGPAVLHDIDLTIPAGSTVAIVGRTGSGKSTLARLMARQYDPRAGRVTLDGSALPSLSLRGLRGELGVVPQDPFLFSMTVEQNTRFGLDALEHDPSVARGVPTAPLLDASGVIEDQRERTQQALEVAGLSRDLDGLPEGLETMVGERGVTLSGGQKQRVTIARALLVDPRVLILDDALSSVDAQTERVILDHLERLMRDRTSVIITHRYAALTRVDRIVVLDEGRIVEQGTHDELLDAAGLYAELYQRQRLRERLEE